ncbi:PKD domain-containing protein [Reinekea marinisedimentorum]|uniref:Cellulose binding domain-containing protein n=1 Tax=Reinekea marinisedimentorum TaxID=230495 RepID=A0A4R3ICP6_9GAMM|nr:cellulose binding domain-containing protein [Reinekea marinisedimentorum]TCS42385.1 cellulose binding domain-containing protein [Reinekea marinisedimentorum]
MNGQNCLRLISASVMLFSACLSAAETFYVSSADELTDALASVEAGDTILLAGGTYQASTTTGAIATGNGGTVNRSWYYRAEADGTADAPITLKSQYDYDPAVLSGAGWSESGYTLYVTGDYWVIEDIAVTEGAKGIMLANSDYSEINNVEIYNMGQEGLHILDGSSYNTIDGINIHDVGKNDDGYGEGIYIGSDNSVWWEGDGVNTGESGLYYHRDVHDNLITNSIIGPEITAEPFDIKEGAYNNIVEYSTIYGSGISGNNFADSHIDIKGYDTIIRYNTFYQDANENISRAIMIVPRTSAGVDAEYTAHDIYVHDNVFYMDEDDVEVLVANSGSENIYAWDNVRDPAEGNWYNSLVIEEVPEGYDEYSDNQTPVADAGSDISAETASQVVLDGSSSSDPDGDELTYSWSQTSGTEVSLENTSSALAQFYAETTGEYVFSLVVDDGEATASDSVTVTISNPDDIDDGTTEPSDSSTQLSCVIGSENVWSTGFVLNNIEVTNNSDSSIEDWQVQVQLGATDVTVNNYWGSEVTLDGDIATAVNASYNGNLDAGESTTFGLKGTYSGTWGEASCYVSGSDTSTATVTED